MKTRLLSVLVAGLALLFGTQAYAQSAREDIVHAYVLVKAANHDYAGHRNAAIKALEDAGRELGLEMKGKGSAAELQMQSDGQMAEASRILHVAQGRLTAEDRKHAAKHVDKAIEEIDLALKKK
jgi:hypothetical protein